MRYALILTWSVALASGAEYDPNEVLGRMKERVLASVQGIPNYTCVETVRREFFDPLGATLPRDCPVLLEQRKHRTPDMILRPYSADRLRLDVTMAGKGEIFSWSGASHFEDENIDSVVRYGPMATGGFAGFLYAIFKSDVKHFKFERSTVEKGHTLLEYSFDVAQPDSHYSIKAYNSWVRIAYRGSFQVDAETAELVHLVVHSGESPAASGICLTTTTMDLERVRIGEGQFLLPRQVGQRFVYPNVQEVENTTVFANCREFRGESTVTFAPDEDAKRVAAKSGAAGPTLLPAGSAFSFALTTPIDTDTAAAGDAFSGKLTDGLREFAGKALAPKGTVVEGRLLRVQSFAKPPEVIVVIRPEAMWIRGVRVGLSAVRDWALVSSQLMRQGKKLEILMPLQGEDGCGVFRFPGEHTVIPAGFRSDWKTVQASPAVTSR